MWLFPFKIDSPVVFCRTIYIVKYHNNIREDSSSLHDFTLTMILFSLLTYMWLLLLRKKKEPHKGQKYLLFVVEIAAHKQQQQKSFTTSCTWVAGLPVCILRFIPESSWASITSAEINGCLGYLSEGAERHFSWENYCEGMHSYLQLKMSEIFKNWNIADVMLPLTWLHVQ